MSCGDRITKYLTDGGLFNPELADHEAVRDLLIDCRAELRVHMPVLVNGELRTLSLSRSTFDKIQNAVKFLDMMNHQCKKARAFKLRRLSLRATSARPTSPRFSHP
jgi:hypothetical protein